MVAKKLSHFQRQKGSSKEAVAPKAKVLFGAFKDENYVDPGDELWRHDNSGDENEKKDERAWMSNFKEKRGGGSYLTVVKEKPKRKSRRAEMVLEDEPSGDEQKIEEQGEDGPST